MADPHSLDPFVLVREIAARLEKGFNAVANPLIASDGFSSGANKAVNASLVAKKLARELSQRYFELLNLPSRRDFAALGDRLQALEDRMIELQSTLDRLAGGAGTRAALPAPTRTRKPPAAVIDVVATPARKRAPARTRKPKP